MAGAMLMDEQDRAARATRDHLEKTLRFALDIVSDGIWDWNMLTDDVQRSPGWYRMLGYPTDGLPGNVLTWHSVIHPDDFEQVMAAFSAYLEGRAPTYAEEYRCRCADGNYLWVTDQGRFVEFDAQGAPIRMIGAHRNIHERKLAELELQRRNAELNDLNQRLEQRVASRTEALRLANQALAEQAALALRLSETDPLTQIHNRRRFERALQDQWQSQQRGCLLMFDLDHFKRINDEHGHLVGDEVLVEVASQVGAALAEHACFARWGGEEFIILLPEVALEEGRQLAERLRTVLRGVGVPRELALTASFALVEVDGHENAQQLLHRLDAALYRAKARRDCLELA
ncbi:MAG: putative diguanylate cyclase DgcT [Stenotrophomonas maltophilia]|nr:MAG: putative diguanylate cyclase DgcT [Stenotrophomonas maltophilia]